MIIPLTQGKIAEVDDEDYKYIKGHKWCAHKNHGNWYAVTNVKVSEGKWVYMSMHKLLMNIQLGQQIDHIDQNGLNNNRSNLRIVSSQQNSFNRRSHRNSSSKYKGVSWHKSRNKWQAYVCFNGRLKYLGIFNDEKRAAEAYNIAASHQFGSYSCLNII